MFNTLIVFIAGLIIGSFLNVVIYRLPKMIEEESSNYSLLLPRSQCAHCKKTLHWFHNIPLLSFLFLKGRCAFCQAKIAWRYPVVEVGMAMIGAVLFWRFGLTELFFASAFFSAILWALMWIDWQTQLLPDHLTLLLLWAGLLVSTASLIVSPASAIIGAIAGYGVLWLVAKIYLVLTQREGMGYGDFKLLAAIGAWLGWENLPMVILIASLMGMVVGVFLMVTKKHTRLTPIAFGPYLAIAAWLALIIVHSSVVLR